LETHMSKASARLIATLGDETDQTS
jgi:hypothetical protein